MAFFGSSWGERDYDSRDGTGYDVGYNTGYEVGREAGLSDGYDSGWNASIDLVLNILEKNKGNSYVFEGLKVLIKSKKKGAGRWQKQKSIDSSTTTTKRRRK